MLASIDDDRTINLEQHTVFDHQHLCQQNVDAVGWWWLFWIHEYRTGERKLFVDSSVKNSQSFQ